MSNASATSPIRFKSHYAARTSQEKIGRGSEAGRGLHRMLQADGFGQMWQDNTKSYAELSHVVYDRDRSKRYFHEPTALSRFYSKYSH